jgi:hypothetical protein
MRIVHLAQYQALVRQVQIAARSPFTSFVKRGAQFGVDRVWLLVQVVAHLELELRALVISHVQAIASPIDKLTG